jgi:hypothetical protein
MIFDQVHLVGLGGTGSHLALPMVQMLKFHKNAGDARIFFWDGDEFEEKNLERQAFKAEGLSANKAIVKAQELKYLNPNIGIWDTWCKRKTLIKHFTKFPAELPLIILAVDNDATRNEVITFFDALPAENHYAMILPGNGFTSFNCFWYGRINGEICPVHPFNVADNWMQPRDGMPGGCGAVVESSPQIITANMGAAWSSMVRLYSLLENKPMCFNMDHSLEAGAVYAEGRPKFFSKAAAKCLKDMGRYEASVNAPVEDTNS